MVTELRDLAAELIQVIIFAMPAQLAAYLSEVREGAAVRRGVINIVIGPLFSSLPFLMQNMSTKLPCVARSSVGLLAKFFNTSE